MENKAEQSPKKNSNVLYFLIIVVVALLGTDIYLYLQKNTSDKKYVYVHDEKIRLQTELDSLEAQIELVNASKAKLTDELKEKNDSLRLRIAALRKELTKGELTKEELAQAREAVKQLRYFVTKYTAEIEDLKKQNTSLAIERDTLKTNLAVATQKASNLEQENKTLTAKVQAAAALKIANANVVAYKIKDSGKETDVTRAKTAKKLKINFTILPNAVAAKTLHDIYLRVIDNTGNLITTDESGVFTADDQELQYSYKTAIEYKNDESLYTIDWINPLPFQKGTYTLLLYTDGFIMGKTSISLR